MRNIFLFFVREQPTQVYIRRKIHNSLTKFCCNWFYWRLSIFITLLLGSLDKIELLMLSLSLFPWHTQSNQHFISVIFARLQFVKQNHYTLSNQFKINSLNVYMYIDRFESSSHELERKISVLFFVSFFNFIWNYKRIVSLITIWIALWYCE